MSSRLAAEFFHKGIEALRNDHTYLARVCLENALREERTPTNCSYFALALAKSRGEFTESVVLAEEAVAAEPSIPEHYLNLGRIYLLAGNKEKALEAFRAGMQHGNHPEIQQELDLFSPRSEPVLSWLRRNHPLNKYLGLLACWLGLRKAK